MRLHPFVSEKAIALADEQNTYVFVVPKTAEKVSIRRDIEQRFGVTVTKIRTVIVKGKPKQMIVQRGKRRISGKRSDMKKAYVTLQSGDSIPLFEGGEE